MGKHFTIASNQGTVGGGEVMLFAIAEAARKLGRNVTVVAPAEPSNVADESRKRGFHTVAIAGASTAQYLRNLRRWDSKHRKGLLWCNGLRPAFATSGHPDRVVELHQRPEGKLRPMAKLATKGARRLVVPSTSMAEAIPSAEVMWNWSEPVTGHRSSSSTDLPDATTVGFLGRLSSDKGVGVLCAAMEALEQRQPGKFRLLLAGESRFVEQNDAARVASAIKRLGPLVENRGWIGRDDFFAQTDIAVFPSVWPEPFGLVVTEAMSARVPFVVSDAGALHEVAGDGWVARANDAAHLADVIEAAAANPQRYTEQSYVRWEEHFSPEQGQARLKHLLDEIDPAASDAPRVALAHDYLTQRGGAERVALTLAQAFPDAELTTAVYSPSATYPELRDVPIKTSWLNRWKLLHRNFRIGLPFYGLAFSTTEAGRDADVVVVSTTGYAHGVKTRAKKLVYCHSPARFLYLVDDYLGKPWWKSPTGWVLMALRPALVAWDQAAARSADVYLANSTVVKQRIKDVYGIDAKVVHPPFAIDPDGAQEPITLRQPASQFYVVISRLMPYKHVDVVIDAFRKMPDRHLLVIGRGPLGDQLRANLPANVTMAEGVTDAQIRWAYANATAVIAPSHEDFGLTPVEGFAFGTPTLALRAGGYLDTVSEGTSGWFFDEATPAAIAAAVRHLDSNPIRSETIERYGQRFAPDTFIASINAEIQKVVAGG